MTQQTESVATPTVATPAKATPAEAIVVEPMRGPADARAFKELNEAWIVELFSLEPADTATLDDPEGKIVAKGGQVLIAREGDDAVGCVALVPEGDGVFELSKMAVARDRRGRGLGRILLQAAVDYAREQGAEALFLGSNSRLKDAVHLYESIGFVHVPPEDIGPMPYDRADVFMRYDLA